MKIQAQHAAYITAAVQKIDTEARRNVARAAGHTDKRYRWDCFWATDLTKWVCDTIYLYADDTHLDTVLRNAVPKL